VPALAQAQEPLQDSYESHVRTAREAALEAITGLSFSGTLDGMQVAARHAYAMTYQKEYVQDWAKQLSEGQWGGRVEEDEDRGEISEIPQTRYVCLNCPLKLVLSVSTNLTSDL